MTEFLFWFATFCALAYGAYAFTIIVHALFFTKAGRETVFVHVMGWCIVFFAVWLLGMLLTHGNGWQWGM